VAETGMRSPQHLKIFPLQPDRNAWAERPRAGNGGRAWRGRSAHPVPNHRVRTRHANRFNGAFRKQLPISLNAAAGINRT
jgi:hypothetical protein